MPRPGRTTREVRTPWGVISISGGETAVDWCLDMLHAQVKAQKALLPTRVKPSKPKGPVDT